ncbi:MAG: type II secretion system protein N [Burkholderiales bacterium]
MRIVAILVVGFGLLLAALAAFAPATIVDRSLESRSEGRLRVADAAGTIWNGSGVLTDARNTWRVPLRWTIDARTLVSDTHVAALSPVDGAAAPTGTIGVGRDSVTLRNLAFDLPAQALAAALTPRGVVTLGGTVELRTNDFTWSDAGSAGSLALRWRDARLVAAGVVADLGVVDLALAPQGNRLAGRIVNSGGEVRLDGTVTLGSDAASVDVTAAPTATASPSLARALAVVGTPDGSGAVRLGWRGSLRQGK